MGEDPIYSPLPFSLQKIDLAPPLNSKRKQWPSILSGYPSTADTSVAFSKREVRASPFLHELQQPKTIPYSAYSAYRGPTLSDKK